MVDQLKFVDSHNIAGYFLDPPVAHNEFKSMIVGLNNCRIYHALRSNIVIYKDLVTEFCKNAAINKHGADGVGTIESMVKGTQVIVSEQIIREVLEFGDVYVFAIDYIPNQVKGVLEKMCCEGTYPPTIKKLLPLFWRFLAHCFVICISGRKGGAYEISHTATSVIIALAME